MDYTIRVACYERVSTEEQSKHGLSIDAQIAVLGRWVTDQHHILVGHYTDAGVSGGKPIDKRPAMWRLLQDIQSGLVDLVIFTKLDRWFRSLKNYYKAQEILDSSHCAWQAIDEDYETLTASGRFKVNIMLSVAENERERTSERIKAVFDFRAARGEFLSGGHAVPCGYKLEGKHLIKDPEREPAVNRLFEMILAGVPTGTAVRQVREEYQGLPCYTHMCRMIYNPHYAGIHNGQSGFCPQYITEAQHEIILQRRGTRTPKHPETPYYYSGIVCCPVCGRKMASTRSIIRNKLYVYYFCTNGQLDRDCPFTGRLEENRLERALMGLLFTPGEIVIDSIKPAQKPEKPPLNPKEIEGKMKRLAETYTDGLIDRDTYKRKLADLTQQLQTAREAPSRPAEPVSERVREFLQGDVQTVYGRFTRAEKRRFWHTLLLGMKADASYQITDIVYTNV